MRLSFFYILLASTFLFSPAALAQDPIMNALRMNYTDVAETKRKAEAGDAAAQFTLAGMLANKNWHADALAWYEKAAQQGNPDAVYRVAHTLLHGANGVPREQSVKADPATAILLIFRLATNRYTPAYYDLYTAYRDGYAVPQDNVQAYAWLQLDVDTAPLGFVTGSVHQSQLNDLALKVDVATSQAGKRLAALFKAGQWPTLKLLLPASPPSPAPVLASTPVQLTPAAIPPRPAPRPDPGLKLNGIALGKIPLAIINGKSLAEGETITLPLKPYPVTLKCLKIETNSVLVSLQGEELPRRLYR